jgi:hypothetical protein
MSADYCPPNAGGCWYCNRKDDDLVFCREFDTWVHRMCALRASRDLEDQEAQIINAEVNGSTDG